MSATAAYPHQHHLLEHSPPATTTSTSTAAAGPEGANMSKVVQSAQNIYLLSQAGNKRGLDQPALKRILRELCDLESQLTTISPSNSSRPSSPVADVCSSPSSPTASSDSSPVLSSTPSRLTSSSSSSPSTSSSAAKRNISKSNTPSNNNKKKQQQLRRKAYVCSGCGATESSQWRNGPDGTKICNPCGMKFWRLKRKMMKRQSEETETATPTSAVAAARPVSPAVPHLHHLRPHHQSHQANNIGGSHTAAALGLQHLHSVAAGQLAPTFYAPPSAPQQLFRPFQHGGSSSFSGSFISNQSLYNQNDEEVMAAGMMMQHLRSASFSSLTPRSSNASDEAAAASYGSLRSTPSSSFSRLSSPFSSLSGSSSSLSFSSMSSPSSSPSPSPTPENDTEQRKRSSIYDLLN